MGKVGGGAIALSDALTPLGANRDGAVEGTWLAAIAHELRAPLNTIVMSSEVLVTGADGLTEGQARSAATIHHVAIWLQGLLENLLCAAAVREGALRLYPVSLTVEELLHECQLVAGPILARRQQRLRFATRGLGGTVRADRRRLVQALVNLTANASKYSPAGSAIDLAVMFQKTSVRFSVSDRGSGIPESERQRVFEPFVRLARQSDHPADGVGLGLAIVKSIVEAHGGSIRVDGRRGGGTRISFDLPATARLR